MDIYLRAITVGNVEAYRMIRLLITLPDNIAPSYEGLKPNHEIKVYLDLEGEFKEGNNNKSLY